MVKVPPIRWHCCPPDLHIVGGAVNRKGCAEHEFEMRVQFPAMFSPSLTVGHPAIHYQPFRTDLLPGHVVVFAFGQPVDSVSPWKVHACRLKLVCPVDKTALLSWIRAGMLRGHDGFCAVSTGQVHGLL
jgi:hypothetical protein